MTENSGESALANSLTYPQVSSPPFRGNELVRINRLGLCAWFNSVGGGRFGHRALGKCPISSCKDSVHITPGDQQQDSRYGDKRIYV